ncbi:MAG TPA: hypothetical protein PLH03_04485 [Methylophilaceae bacterium]|nr:hypothetical protein [Methylophilaceae bacterium]
MELPSPAALFAIVMFGIVGFAAFRYGKKNGRLNPMLLGVGLMVYPYFISQIWLLYVIGCVLCAALYFLRDWG